MRQENRNKQLNHTIAGDILVVAIFIQKTYCLILTAKGGNIYELES
jgi:hypothetical protein